jgi:hypothetical protein
MRIAHNSPECTIIVEGDDIANHIESTTHDVIDRSTGRVVGTIECVWEGHNIACMRRFGSVSDGVMSLARWDFSDAADAADALYEIRPSIG